MNFNNKEVLIQKKLLKEILQLIKNYEEIFSIIHKTPNC